MRTLSHAKLMIPCATIAYIGMLLDGQSINEMHFKGSIPIENNVSLPYFGRKFNGLKVTGKVIFIILEFCL